MKLFYAAILLLSLVLLVAACKTKKKVQQDESTVTTTVTNSSAQNAENKEREGKLHLVASIQRTPCFGRCPTYKYEVYSDGKVKYEGTRFVDKMGFWEGKATQEQIKTVLAEAKKIKFFSFEENYPTGGKQVMDVPTCAVTINDGKQEKRVMDKLDAPKELADFEKYLDEFFKNITLTQNESQPQINR